VREARAAAGVAHDNVVPVYAVGGPSDGPPYLVMQYVEGPTLRERIKAEGRLDPHEAARVCAQAAEGLAAAHRAGLVHRDIKPANIILDRVQGRAKIMDFGLARATALPGGITQAGTLLGTPEYMSPEQLQEPDRVDGRTDVYSLGVTLYEALTGEVPFRGLTHLVLQQVLSDDPRLPRRLNDKVPRDLETICLKCLHKEPGQRYAGARDLADDLGRFLAGNPIRARPVRAWERAAKWARRRPAAAALVAVSSLASLLLVAGLAAGIVVIADKQWQTENALGREKEAREEVGRAYRRFQQTSYLNGIAAAAHELSGGNWGRGDELLEECPEDLRGWEWHYLKRLRHTPPIAPLPVGERVNMHIGFDLAFHPNGRLLAIPSSDHSIRVWDASGGRGQPMLTLRGHTARVLGVAFSPDGRLLASTSADKTVRLWDFTGAGRPGAPAPGGRALSPLHTLSGHQEWVIGVAFSPDGQRLASVSGETDKPGRVKVWDAASGELLFTFPGQAIPNPVVRLAFSPDGRRLASGSLKNAVKVWDLTTGQEVHTLSGHTEHILNVAFSPDGRRLLSAGQDRVVNVWDLGDVGRGVLAPRRTLPHISLSPWCMDLSPDGSRLAIGGPAADGNVRVYDTTTGELLLTLMGDARIDRVISVAFSPDGRRLASVGADRIVRLWDTTTGHEVLTLRGHSDVVGRVLFSPGGQRLASASADGTVRVWDASPVDENPDPRIRTLGGQDGEFWCVAFSPKDSWLLASASADGFIKLWDAQTGQEVRALHGHKEPPRCVAFSPDGRRLLSGSMDKTVKLWDVRTGKELRSDGGFKVIVRSVAFSPDGKAFATGSHQRLQLRDTQTGRELLSRQADLEFVTFVTFSPDGKHLATAGHTRTAKVWDVTSGETVCSFEGHQTSVFCVAFHPQGRYLASGDSDFKVKLWDPATGREIRTLSGHTDFVQSVAFSRDGRYLATASWREVIVWDANRFEKLQALGRLAGKIWGVAFSADGQRLAAAGGSKGKGEIKIWDASLWEDKP
jgi:WD40 repeat protein